VDFQRKRAFFTLGFSCLSRRKSTQVACQSSRPGVPPARCEGAGIRSKIPAEIPARVLRLYSMLVLGSGDPAALPFVPLPPAEPPAVELLGEVLGDMLGLTGPTPWSAA
jgi:hypothetical protein